MQAIGLFCVVVTHGGDKMEKFKKEALDRYITGNYGENQFKGLSGDCNDGDYVDCDMENCSCKCHDLKT